MSNIDVNRSTSCHRELQRRVLDFLQNALGQTSTLSTKSFLRLISSLSRWCSWVACCRLNHPNRLALVGRIICWRRLSRNWSNVGPSWLHIGRRWNHTLKIWEGRLRCVDVRSSLCLANADHLSGGGWEIPSRWHCHGWACRAAANS